MDLEKINKENDQLDESCHKLHTEYQDLCKMRDDKHKEQLTLTEENDILAVELEDFLNMNEQIQALIEKKA